MSARRTKRTDGRYDVTLTVEALDGTRRGVYFYGRTQAEARRKADAARERLAAGGPVRDATRSVSDWLVEWTGTFLQASDRDRSTKSLYAGLTLRHVEPVLGRTPLGQVRPSDVTRVLLAMERGGSAASTRRNAYAAMRSAFDDAVADGLLALNPVLRVRHPKASSAEASSLTVGEATRFLDGAEGLRYAAVLRLILGTGLRRGETLALRWPDVDLRRAEASVRGSLVRVDGTLVVADTKSARSRRTISLSPAVVLLLATQTMGVLFLLSIGATVLGLVRRRNDARDRHQVDCSLRVVEGMCPGLTSQWRGGAAVIEQGEVRLQRMIGVRFLLGRRVDLSVVRVGPRVCPTS